MRSLLAAVVVVAACVLALPAGAAEVDPKALVLARADLPAGFRLDRDESGLRTNAREGSDGPAARRLIARTGRVTGYETSWDKGAVALESRADLCRRPAGAKILLDYIRDEMTKSGIKGLRRAPAGIGSKGWIYTGGTPGAFVLVAWRYDRVFAGIVGIGLTRSRALALARAQQRRIAAALG